MRSPRIRSAVTGRAVAVKHGPQCETAVHVRGAYRPCEAGVKVSSASDYVR